jgi:K+-transporting ATPase KdpF subunit
MREIGGAEIMTSLYVLGALVAAVLMIYLIYALINAEEF